MTHQQQRKQNMTHQQQRQLQKRQPKYRQHLLLQMILLFM